MSAEQYLYVPRVTSEFPKQPNHKESILSDFKYVGKCVGRTIKNKFARKSSVPTVLRQPYAADENGKRSKKPCVYRRTYSAAI